MCQWSLIYFIISVLAAHLSFLASLNLVRPYNTAGLGSRILPLEAFMASWLMAVTLIWILTAGSHFLHHWVCVDHVSKHLWMGPLQGIDIAVGNWNCFRVVWPGILILIPSRWGLLSPEIFSKSYLLFSCAGFEKAWGLKQFFFSYLPSFPYWRQLCSLPQWHCWINSIDKPFEKN